MRDAKWFEDVYPVMDPLKVEAVNILVSESSVPVRVHKLLQLTAKVVRDCRAAGIEIDEAELLESFASLVFQHLAG